RGVSKSAVAGIPASLTSLCPFSVRHERELPFPQEVRIRALDFEPALTGGDDVEHHAPLERRQLEGPRRRQLATAVEDAAHAQEVKRVTERIDRLPEIIHADN